MKRIILFLFLCVISLQGSEVFARLSQETYREQRDRERARDMAKKGKEIIEAKIAGEI